MVNFYERLLIKFVSIRSGCRYRRVTLPRKWKALFLLHRSRLYLLILSKLISTRYLALSPKCRLCGVADEHLINSCSFFNLTLIYCKGRHDAIVSLIHCASLKQAGVQVQTLWWKHVPTDVLDTHDFKLLQSLLPSITIALTLLWFESHQMRYF